MARRVGSAVAISLSLLLACGLWASAQAAPPKKTSQGQDQARLAEPATTISLGQSLVPLYGPWKFQAGDSPADPATSKPVGQCPASTIRNGKPWI
jgi:hypothetical protein